MSKQAEKYLELTYKDSIMPKKYHAWTFDEVTKEMEAYHQSSVNAIMLKKIKECDLFLINFKGTENRESFYYTAKKIALKDALEQLLNKNYV